MNTRFKQLVKELGDAINGSLAESEQIALVISRIKEEGFDVFLVLEATVGFNRLAMKPGKAKAPNWSAPAPRAATLNSPSTLMTFASSNHCASALKKQHNQISQIPDLPAGSALLQVFHFLLA